MEGIILDNNDVVYKTFDTPITFIREMSVRAELQQFGFCIAYTAACNKYFYCFRYFGFTTFDIGVLHSIIHIRADFFFLKYVCSSYDLSETLRVTFCQNVIPYLET